MARDEARHAGFLNKAMSDFGMQLDLDSDCEQGLHLFPAEIIFYATYLSEKIGYWRYIAIYAIWRRILKVKSSRSSTSSKIGARTRTVTATSSMHS